MSDKAILLLDNYGQDSQLLKQSLSSAGFDGPVIVVDDDGFLPDDVISIARYFCGSNKDKAGVSGKPRYFNQINVPDYWEISANNTDGKVCDLYHVRGKICYSGEGHKRLVSAVDWYDEKGVIRSTDHYDKYGVLYARTCFSGKGERFCKSWLDYQGKEILVENYLTKDIVLNYEGKVYFYNDKVSLIKKMIVDMGLESCRLFYNSLSVPFFVSEALPENGMGDVLFWQEGPRNDVPGNMQFINDLISKRTGRIFVQKNKSYENLVKCGINDEIVNKLGHIYKFNRKNTYGNEILICTNSDSIEKLEELIKLLPDMHFNIAAITEMSTKLLDMGKYPNVSLFPTVRQKTVDDLFNKCDFYLDINNGGEILSAVRNAFMFDQLVLGFRQTLHNTLYIAAGHIFDSRDYASLAEFLKQMMQSKEMMDNALETQRNEALSENKEKYITALGL